MRPEDTASVPNHQGRIVLFSIHGDAGGPRVAWPDKHSALRTRALPSMAVSRSCLFFFDHPNTPPARRGLPPQTPPWRGLNEANGACAPSGLALVAYGRHRPPGCQSAFADAGGALHSVRCNGVAMVLKQQTALDSFYPFFDHPNTPPARRGLPPQTPPWRGLIEAGAARPRDLLR